jgi:hypothetical protein
VVVRFSFSKAWSRSCCNLRSWIVLYQTLTFIFPSNNKISNFGVFLAIALIPPLEKIHTHIGSYMRTNQNERNKRAHYNLHGSTPFTYVHENTSTIVSLSQIWLIVVISIRLKSCIIVQNSSNLTWVIRNDNTLIIRECLIIRNDNTLTIRECLAQMSRFGFSAAKTHSSKF